MSKRWYGVMRPETRQPSRMTDLQRHLAVKRVTCVAANMFSDWLKFLWRWKIRHCPERQKLHFLKTTHTIWLCSVLQQTKSDWRGFSVGGMNRVLQETDSVIIILIKKTLPFWRLCCWMQWLAGLFGFQWWVGFPNKENCFPHEKKKKPWQPWRLSSARLLQGSHLVNYLVNKPWR